MGFNTVRLNDVFHGVLHEPYQLLHMADYAAQAVYFDWKGYYCIIAYRSLEMGYYRVVEAVLDFEEQMQFMRDGTGPIWG